MIQKSSAAKKGTAAGTVWTVLVVLWCQVAVGGPAQDWPDAEEPPLWEEAAAQRRAAADAVAAGGPEIREPFFAFLTDLAAGDSLGLWSGKDIEDFAENRGHTSLFPVELIDQVVRRRPDRQERLSWPKAAVRAVWEISLVKDLDRRMPYSILGYHPGSLRVSNRLRLTEVRGGTMALHRGQNVFVVKDVVMFRLDEGHVIMDVDGLVDRLLGKTLDDSGTVGFVLARQDGQLFGLAVALSRKGRRIYGEFDFRRDKVLAHGRPLARALSAACRRRMLDGYLGPPLGAWVDDR